MRTRLTTIATAAASTLAVTVAGLTMAAGPAAAHAELLNVNPADGTTVTRAPSSVTVTYNEAVTFDPANIQLLDERARQVPGRVTSQNAAGGGRTIRFTPSRTLASGMYAARWSVTSSDGHTVTQASVFSVGRTPKPQGRQAVTLAPGPAATYTNTRTGKGQLTVRTPAKTGTVTLTHPSLGAPLVWPITGDGRTATGSGLLPYPGQWKVTVTLRTSTFTTETKTGAITLR